MAPTSYISLIEVIAIHNRVMEATGFAPAPLRDQGMLESAIMRPRMYANFEQADLVRQAAFMAIAISQAQAFLDGNKRTAYAVADLFLRRNGLMYSGDAVELARQLEAVAEREDDLDAATGRFEGWLRANVGFRNSGRTGGAPSS